MTTKIYGDYEVYALAGSGGFGKIIVVTNMYEIHNRKAYILKTLIGNFIPKTNIELLQREIDLLLKLNENPRSKYIPYVYAYDKYYYYGKKDEEKVEENNNIIIKEDINKIKIPKKITPYYVMDYFSKGNLYYYIENVGKDIGFPEKYARVIFKKILEGIKFCHERKICHLDLKPENIALDENFEPIILDFGLSDIFKDEKDNINELKRTKGTKKYAPPEVWENRSFNGVKSDIFSLGVFLFKLVTNKYCFKECSSEEDKYYSKLCKEKNILNGPYTEYWNEINKEIKVQLSENFKRLYILMVAKEPGDRPKDIDAILNSDWMNKFNNLSEQEKINLEKEVKDKLKEIYCNIKEKIQYIRLADGMKLSGFITRGGNKETKASEKTPKKIPNDRININLYIILDEALSPNNFMSDLIKDINNEFGTTKIAIREFKEYEHLKFKLGFYKLEENNEEENEEEEEDIDSDKKCVMEIELFQYENGKYLLEFLRTKGEIPDYYKKFLDIKKIIEEKILK